MARSSSRRRLASALPGDPTTDFSVSLPWGYAPQAGVLAPTPQAAPLLRQVFSLASEGVEPEQIAGQVNLEGSDAPDDEVSLIKAILDNPAYAGVWLTVGKLNPIVDPETWIKARTSLGAIEPGQADFVRAFGSAPADEESTDSASVAAQTDADAAA